jgi:SprT protein
MSQIERNKSILSKYIPDPAVPIIAEWIYVYDFKLKIKKSRSSKYGDYRPPLENTNHHISVNHDLNPYAFLITLVHEIAHLSNYKKNSNNVKPHGEEWKQEFRILMVPFINLEVFPTDVNNALTHYLRNPAASSCSDISLLRILKKYDKREGAIFLEDLPAGTIFIFGRGRHFKKGEKIRKRFCCLEINTRRKYLFNPLSEVTVAGTSILG